MLSNKKLNPIVTKLFVRGRKLNKRSKIIYQLKSWILTKKKKKKKKTRPQNLEKTQEKKDIFENLHGFFEGRDRFRNASKSKIFPSKIEDKVFQTRSLNILISKY